ncbi:hypothetical protein ACIA49_32945 [Kribbella sp. NPDC051587]|uniref:hypothetical protein n=1 Tax=Kribbella sp. NPDC051587 TaxID=3364119 RepID=UPI0037BA4133
MSEVFVDSYYCEHANSKSRVLALLSTPNSPPTLRAVLTCSDRSMAEHAAHVLTQIAASGSGPHVNLEAERVAAALPDAPAASFRKEIEAAIAHDWDAPTTINWAEVHSRYAFEQSDDKGASPSQRDAEFRTPADARLADLSGVVVRIARLEEFHIYDPQRLIAEAAAQNWVPWDEEEDGRQIPVDDPDNLADAAMWILDSGDGLSGADLISQTARGEVLVADSDEVRHWADDPIELSFMSGLKLSTPSES